MHNGQGEHDEREGHEETQVTVLDVMKSPTQQSENEAPEEAAEDQAVRSSENVLPPRLRYSRRISLMAAAGVLLLVVILLTLFADAGHASTRTVHTPHPTPIRPTPTATAIPSPTPMLGFQIYTDHSDEFLIQYPHDWVNAPANPGIEFTDDVNNPAYIVQILMPGDATSAGLTSQRDDASVWVDYELNNLEKLYQGNYQQVPGPAPSATIGNVVWQSGVALFTSGTGANQARVRVQVYATVYNGRPYIINLLAADDRFSAGTIQFFTPMLQSFKFLPPTA